MRRIIGIILMCVCIFCLCGCIRIIIPAKEYVDYYEQLGINEMIFTDTAPLREEEIDGYLYKYYEDICIVFYENGGFVRAEILGDTYKFDKGVSVGSKRDWVESVFIGKQKIKDLEKNQFGFIEDYIWIHFYFDENDTVEKILVYSGP